MVTESRRKCCLRSAAVSLVAVLIAAVAGEVGSLRTLDDQTHHLGTPGEPEWQEFVGKSPDGRSLELHFTAQTSSHECTLFLRQRDVKLQWTVQLNGRKIGQLHPMETDLVHVLAVPPGTLRDGDNVLSITPPGKPDDILVGEIALDTRPIAQALALATLDIAVSDGDTGRDLPCRITITDAQGSLAPIVALPGAAIAVRPGVAYTPSGRAVLGVRPGAYTVYATRGFEYGLDTQTASIAAGESRRLRMRIRHEVATDGYASCDTHIHTLTHSGHGDATIDERMITIAGEGIELAIATDHNHHTDYTEPAARMGVADQFTPVVGNEVTTHVGHFNAFPADASSPVPDFRLTDWPELVRSIRATPGVRVVILNHPRDVHEAFRPFGPENFDAVAGEIRMSPEFQFDGVEVITSGALQSDPMRLYRDWFALLNHGCRVASVASSDSHDVSRYIVGQGRTYVAVHDARPDQIDVAEACRSFLEGRVLVSMGLLAQMTVADHVGLGELASGLGDQVRVAVTVLGPSWTTADRVELFANGVPIREEKIEPRTGATEKARVRWSIPRPAHDVYLVAIASGPGVTGPYWGIPRPYQPSALEWEPRVIGSTNPIYLDGDGDGRYTSPRAYAAAIVQRVGTRPEQLIPALGVYDEAVAAQAASLYRAAGGDADALARQLESAAPAVRRGFAAVAATADRSSK